MRAGTVTVALWAMACTQAAASSTEISGTEIPDRRLRHVVYDPGAVVTVPVKPGVVTLVVLGADESITEVASGLGADCAKPEASWCIAAQPGGRNLFVKPKSSASSTAHGISDGANNLVVVTDRRTHVFRFVLLKSGDAQPPVYRLIVKPPAPIKKAAQQFIPDIAPLLATLTAPPRPRPAQVVAERLRFKPEVKNSQYAFAPGRDSQDIVPTLVFDDGRFTYMRFPANADLPAVFHVLDDGSESLVNVRMEGELLVVDRVSRRLVLRAGSAVVGLWNEAFDATGRPTDNGTTVPGVHRALKGQPGDQHTGHHIGTNGNLVEGRPATSSELHSAGAP